ncbi:MAG: hypothetical protein AAGE52_17105 [Myxococcota bacterium]
MLPLVCGITRILVFLSLANLVFACGSKTGFLIPPEPTADRDSGPGEGRDAGFDTFPCRWSYQGDVLLLSSDRSLSLPRGAVLPVGPTAMVAVELAGQTTLVGVNVASTPSVRWTQSEIPEGGAVYAVDNSFRRVRGCELERWTLDGERAEPSSIEGCSRTFLSFSPQLGRRVAVWDGSALAVIDAGTGARIERVALVGAPDAFPLVAADGPALVTGDPFRVRYSGADVVISDELGSLPGGAPDRLRDGVIVAWSFRDSLRLARVERSGVVQDYDLSPVPGRRRLSPVTTNETEALFVTEGGQVVFVPLSGTPLGVLEPLAEDVSAAHILLVDGGSAGGVVYIANRRSELRFRTMVCNR